MFFIKLKKDELFFCGFDGEKNTIWGQKKDAIAFDNILHAKTQSCLLRRFGDKPQIKPFAS